MQKNGADDGTEDIEIIFDYDKSEDVEIIFDYGKDKPVQDVEIVVDKRAEVKPHKKKWKRYEQMSEFMWQCPICFEDNDDFRLTCTVCAFNKGQAYYLGEENGFKIWDDGTYKYTVDQTGLQFKEISVRQTTDFMKKKEQLRSE